MKKQFLYLLALIVVIGIGCQKELSFELGDSPAKGSLQSDVSGDCLPKTVNGIYVATTPLVSTSNTITVSVNVTKTGTYAIGTDTVNGYFFRGTGQFTTLGVNTVTLRGNGTPFAQGTNNFVVSFDGTVCDIQVDVLPAGSGPATFTLAGAPNACTTPVISGVYVKGGALNATNTVVLNVTVTVAGTYNVTTALTNGMIFSGSGSLAVGAQTITLTGSQTPTNSGNTPIPITVGTSTCSFTIPVVDPVAGTLGGGPGACTPVTINGTYTKDVPLTAANTIQVQITTAAIGPYSVSTGAAVAGISFSASGTSTGATQLIILTGTGTPTASGPQNFTVTFGGSTCTFSIPVGAGSAFIADCSSAFVNGIYVEGTMLNATNNTVDIDIDVTSIGPYNISTTANNGMVFSDAGTFTTLGIQTITLVGSGTPIADGTFNIAMPGTTPCTFPVDVDPAPSIDWQFTAGGPTTVFNGSADDVQLIPIFPPIITLIYLGSNANDDIAFALVDIAGGINAGETYSTNATVTNAATFTYLVNGGADDFSTDATRNLTFTVSSHIPATKTIVGTFSGNVLNSAGVTRTITLGTFTAVYQ